VPLQSTDSVKVDADNGRVLFEPLHETNEGKYTCKASNDVGEATASGELTVRGQSDSSRSPVKCMYLIVIKTRNLS